MPKICLCTLLPLRNIAWQLRMLCGVSLLYYRVLAGSLICPLVALPKLLRVLPALPHVLAIRMEHLPALLQLLSVLLYFLSVSVIL